MKTTNSRSDVTRAIKAAALKMGLTMGHCRLCNRYGYVDDDDPQGRKTAEYERLCPECYTDTAEGLLKDPE